MHRGGVMEVVAVATDTKKDSPSCVPCAHPILQGQGDGQVCLVCKSAVLISVTVSVLSEEADGMLIPIAVES